MAEFDATLERDRTPAEIAEDAVMDLRAAVLEIADVLGSRDEKMRCPLAHECVANHWRERELKHSPRIGKLWKEAPE